MNAKITSSANDAFRAPFPLFTSSHIPDLLPAKRGGELWASPKNGTRRAWTLPDNLVQHIVSSFISVVQWKILQPYHQRHSPNTSSLGNWTIPICPIIRFRSAKGVKARPCHCYFCRLWTFDWRNRAVGASTTLSNLPNAITIAKQQFEFDYVVFFWDGLVSRLQLPKYQRGFGDELCSNCCLLIAENFFNKINN